MRYLFLFIFLLGVESNSSLPLSKATTDSILKEEAYLILSQKCNVCHIKNNPNKFFTKDNMDGFSKKIKRQVFLWKRMPKGNEIKLTNEEKNKLKKWIKSL